MPPHNLCRDVQAAAIAAVTCGLGLAGLISHPDFMHGLLILLLQVGLVLALARTLGWLFRRIHQPQVMGEMVAGILLGPSLLGLIALGTYAFLFPPESLPALSTLSQVGLLFFMFLVGLELDLGMMKGRVHAAVVISHTSIIVPFGLGALLALYLQQYVPEHVSFLGFALFMGAAMSVTAFPVLARILTERNLLRTRVGAMTIACAAVDDVTAWCILAAVVALVRSTGSASLLLTLGGAVAFILLAFFVFRPLLRHLEAFYQSRGKLTQTGLALALLFMLGCAWTTEWLGIHALFGAFLAGAIMPRDRSFVRELSEKLEDVTVVILLPLFFAFTGLRTRIGLLNDWALWLDCALIIAVAVAGKFGGSTLAARFVGMTWRQASALGTLMNTRGLMELVILTIGLELGVIPPVLFTMMVLMALFTTFMTTPLLHWIYPARLIRSDTHEGEYAEYRVLLPVSLPSSGPDLLRVAEAVAPGEGARYYGLHLIRALDQPLFRAMAESPRSEALDPLLRAAEDHAISVRPHVFVSRSPARDIIEFVANTDIDLVIMGWHKPLISRSVLGGTISEVMQAARADVVVHIARDAGPWRRILVPFMGGLHDAGALEIARRAARRTGAHLTVLHVLRPEQREAVPGLELAASPDAMEAYVEEVKVVVASDAISAAVGEARQAYDLVVVGASETWGMEPASFGLEIERLAQESSSSLLIVHKTPERLRDVPARPAEEAEMG